MLSRTAANLFWLSRYVERAENMARLMEMGHRMAMMPAAGQGYRSEWQSVLAAAGFSPTDYIPLAQAEVADYLVFDPANPSSVSNCLEQARNNARAMRTAITADMWDAINSAHMELKKPALRYMVRNNLPEFLDWVKRQGALFRGATDSTVLRNDGYDFLRLGTFLERADNTARLLDVKYYVLLPETSVVGDSRDSYQWTTVLRAVSALRAFHWVYKDNYTPLLIADFLILNPLSPRSLTHCYAGITDHLQRLARHYGRRSSAAAEALETYSILLHGDMEDIFSAGLHDFLSDFLVRNAALSSSIAESYYFGGQ
ncbi:alpha-E domain-containing protein [Gallaecimonas pentaromativorans]|uniref:Putative alpha-E superfamily protein n=1 Tax=Gallaecimonas pentaromativorans TaxID=584787 RepID=A0A3N1PB83_9GAMM|nr:alpha-E domain-containing protein [Gallaecimonas pentaromativorans]ROQ24317.1 putative alpha-E superfamily protein [Gallaecimonas pentaromativorans]